MLRIATYQSQDKFNRLSDNNHDMDINTNDNRGDSLTKAAKLIIMRETIWRLHIEGLL